MLKPLKTKKILKKVANSIGIVVKPAEILNRNELKSKICLFLRV